MKNTKFLIFTSIVLLMALLFASLAKAQQTTDWQEIAPAGEEFTVMLPKPVRRVNRFVPLQVSPEMSFPMYDAYADRVRYIIIPFDKEASHLPVLKNLDSLSRGFQLAVLSRGQAQNNFVDHERDLESGGHRGRQYRLRMGGYDGIARLYETERHFYILMVIVGQESSSLVDQFFDSFKLGKKNTDGESTKITSETARDDLSLSLPRNPWPTYMAASSGALVSGGLLNAKAMKLPAPSYPQEAILAEATGVVAVQVLVNEQGKVETAKAVSGHPLLQAVAVKAALKAEFKPLLVNGQPVKVGGLLVYNFNSAKR
jgi:TonB family protein